MVLGNRALGINRHLGLVVKVGDALGLGGNGLGGRIDNGLGVDRHIALVSALVLGSIFAVRSGDGLVRILALGLGAYAQSIIKVAEDSAPMASASSGHESSTSKTRSSCSLTRVRPHEMLPARPVSFMSSTVTCSSR